MGDIKRFPTFNVSLGAAVAIVKSRLDDDDIALQTKVIAIEKVANMETHNGITKDELLALSLKKNKLGNATADALKAQRELCDRNGGPVAAHHHANRQHLSDHVHGGYTKKFKE